MRKITHQHLKQNPALDKHALSITHSNYLVNQIRDKMLATQFIIENSNYRKGKSKYLLAKPKRLEIEEKTAAIKPTSTPVLA